MTRKRPRVVMAANYLGVGGTEKGMLAHALALDRDRFELGVVGVLDGGVRRAQFEDAGIAVTVAEGQRDRLASALAGADVVHVFRTGLAEPLVPAAFRDAGARALIETNIFGQVDSSPDESQFACHLFISKMTALRHRRRTGLTGAEFHKRHAVSYLPVDVESLLAAAPEREDAKRRLGLDPNRPVVLRTGRDDDRKWRDLLVDMVPHLLALAPDAQVLFIGATAGKLRRLDRHGVLEDVRLLPLVPEELLPTVYAAGDVFVNAAEIGEAQGLVMIEAMGFGSPVVTCPTPWVDNAQVEIVDEGVDGHVASHPRQFAEAVASLLVDDDRRARYGKAAQLKALERFHPKPLTRQLEDLYDSLLAGRGIPDQRSPSTLEVDEFAAEYERRLRLQFRPLSAREAAEVRRTRLIERGVWAARAARSLDRNSLAFAHWIVRNRLTLVARGRGTSRDAA